MIRHVLARLVLLAAMGLLGTSTAYSQSGGPQDGGLPVLDGGGGRDMSADTGFEESIYVASVTSKSRTRIRWHNSTCVLIRPNTNGAPNITDGSTLDALSRAVARWNDATGGCSYLRLKLQQPTVDALPEYRAYEQNENVIYWVTAKWEHDPRAAGITTVFSIDDSRRPDDGRILDADIELNGTLLYSSSGETGKTDIENTVVHELGHVLGLDHTCDDGERDPVPQDNLGRTIPSCNSSQALRPEIIDATMYNAASLGETKKRTPEVGDILGICEAYPLEQSPQRCAPVEPQGSAGGCEASSAAIPPALNITDGRSHRTWPQRLPHHLRSLIAMAAIFAAWRQLQKRKRGRSRSL